MKLREVIVLFFLIFPAFARGEANSYYPDFYFPHYGDGDGLSMVFTVENPSDTLAEIAIFFFDSEGKYAQMNFVDQGTLSSLNFDLAPKGSLTMRTDGTSSPLKIGYVAVYSENENVTGVAIFQYAWGGETSILPVKAKKRFVLPFEKNNNMDLGLAICRVALNPIEMKLYNPAGELIDSVSYDPLGYHSSAFSFEIFGTIPISNGILTLESESPFAPVGLRFGNGVLAALPVEEFKETSQRLTEKLCEPSGYWVFRELDPWGKVIDSRAFVFYEATEDPLLGYRAEGVAFMNLHPIPWDPMDENVYSVDAEWCTEAFGCNPDDNSIHIFDPGGWSFRDYYFSFTSDNTIEGLSVHNDSIYQQYWLVGQRPGCYWCWDPSISP